ncbi:hypothetical protein DYH09_23165 [bacterium CPR1]|nr:hypothetical protein [bacterium CPR1]
MALKPGTVLQDRYRIERSLGRGGSGAVYLSQDSRLAGKQWAIKELVCKDSTQLQSARTRFEREASMLARLRHRNLPLIVDYFFEAPSQFLVMEFVDGPTLAALVEKEGPAGEAQALRWALELGRVLDYLHSQSPAVIFRDLKPENIMVTEERHLKLIDFGLARHFDPDSGRRDTQPSGSVGYAPPEQWEDRVDERSDLYSLGATIYFLLTGKPPSPVYGSHRLKPHRSDIDARTEDLVLKCMQPDPTLRYASAGELIRDLLLLLSDPKLAPPEPRPTPSRPAQPPAPLPPPRRKAPSQPAARPPVWLPALLAVSTLSFVVAAGLGLSGPSAPGPGRTPTPTATSTSEEVADKFRGRELIAQGTPESLRAAAAMLDTLVTRNPEDAEAHILKQNAYALLLRPGPEESGIVRVPALVSLEGTDAPEGRAVLYGLAQAQANINLRGGVDGRQVVIDLYDDRSQTNQALLEAQKITRDPRYLVCFGPFSSQRVLAAAPLFNDAGLPDLAPSASDPRVWEAGPFLFTASDSNDPRLQALADHFASQGFTRGALVVNEDNLLSSSMARAFEQAFTKKGGRIVARASYDDNTQEFSNQVAQLADQGAEFVLASEFRGLPVAQLANTLKKSGLKIPLASQVIPFSRDLIEQGGTDVEGLLLSGYFLPDQDSPAVRKYVDEYHQIFGEREPSHVDAGSYDAAMLLFDALGAALQAPAEGQPLIRIRMQRLAARNYLASIGNDRPPYDGVSGRFALSSRSDLRKVYLLQVKDGRYQRINAP